MTDIPGCYGGPLEPPEPGTLCPDGSAPRDLIADEELAQWLHLGDGEEHPIAAYDIGCDDSYNGAQDQMWCMAQSFFFSIGKWAIGLGSDVMEWALSFEVAELLTPLSGTLSDIYDASLLGPLDVRTLAWVVTAFVAGWGFMTGRFGSGARELATTAFIFALGMFVLANPDGYMEGGRELAQNTSGAILQATDDATGGEPGDAEEVRGRLTGMLQRAFVAEPYDLINWKHPLTGDCAAARDSILRQGPWGSDERPRQHMRDAGCDEEADYNANPTDNRAIAALMIGAAAVIVTFLLLSLSLAVLSAQIVLVLLFSSASVIWVIALFPGARSVLWTWIARLFWTVAITVASVALLAWVAIVTTVVLGHTSDMSIFRRSLIVVVLAFVAYRARAAVDRGLDAAARRWEIMARRAHSPPQPGRPPMPPIQGRQAFSQLEPAAAGAAAGFTAAHVAQRFGRGAKRVPAATRGALQASQATEHGVRRASRAGLDASRKAGHAGKAAVMAPVILPAKIGQAQAARDRRKQGQPARNDRVRAKFAQARASRAQWRQNVAHPLRATRDARSAAQGDSGDTDWV